jgi:CBS domain-containing protein
MLSGVIMSQKLRKIMIEKVVTILPSATVLQAAELMNMHEIGCLVVVDHEKPVGILTERDMLKRIICESKKPATTRVVSLMSKPLITASPDIRAGDAARLMLERNIKKLPVVENGRLVGIVTLTDLLGSEGVTEFLNTISIDGASRRIRKAVSLYSDSLKQHRRKCPLMVKDGFQRGCQDTRCMWWIGDECAVTKLSRQISTEGLLKTDATNENTYQE